MLRLLLFIGGEVLFSDLPLELIGLGALFEAEAAPAVAHDNDDTYSDNADSYNDSSEESVCAGRVRFSEGVHCNIADGPQLQFANFSMQ